MMLMCVLGSRMLVSIATISSPSSPPQRHPHMNTPSPPWHHSLIPDLSCICILSFTPHCMQSTVYYRELHYLSPDRVIMSALGLSRCLALNLWAAWDPSLQQGFVSAKGAQLAAANLSRPDVGAEWPDNWSIKWSTRVPWSIAAKSLHLPRGTDWQYILDSTTFETIISSTHHQWVYSDCCCLLDASPYGDTPYDVESLLQIKYKLHGYGYGLLWWILSGHSNAMISCA